MKCEAENSRGLPCGNEAIDGETFCQVHLKRRSKWYQRATSPYVVIPAILALIGIVADVLGIWTFRGDLSGKTKLLAGIEFIEGGIELNSKCSVGVCGKTNAGVSYDKKYEPVFHMVVDSNAGECLALGFSLLNESDSLVRNVRAQVSLNNKNGAALKFCHGLDISANTIYPGVKMARQFSNINGVDVASYTIDEIAPRNVGFFTVPIQNSPNLLLVSDGKRLKLSGSPSTLRITHSADNSDLGEISAYAYLSKMSDKSQGLTDHTLLFGYHTSFSKAIFSDDSSWFVNRIKSWFSARPHYTEFVIGSYVSNRLIGENLSYSWPTEPIVKQAVTARNDGHSLGSLEKGEYLKFKGHMCSNVVQDIEGAAYRCDKEPLVTTD